MNPKSAIQKGKLLEQFVVDQLRHSGLDKQASRTPGSGSGKLKGDIFTKLPIIIECKNTKGFQAKKFWKQAEDQGLGYSEVALFWHPPQSPLESTKVMVSLQLFMMMAKAFFKEKE